MPRVSILTPVYNGEKYLSETIESVLNQTFQDFEMIIVDDGSTDRSRQIAESYAKRYSGKIRYIYKTNGGPASARNLAIKNSSGMYLALLDADDLWLPKRLEEGVKILDQNPQIGLVHSRTQRLIKDKQAPGIKRDIQFLSGNIYEHLILRRAHISCLTALFRRRCVEEVGLFDEASECIGVEDRELWMRISQKYRVHFIDEDLGLYRMIESGISRNKDRMIAGRKYVLGKHCSGFKNIFIRRYGLARTYKEYADEYLEFRDFLLAKKWYGEAISCWPFYVWPWINYLKCIFKVRVKNVW